MYRWLLPFSNYDRSTDLGHDGNEHDNSPEPADGDIEVTEQNDGGPEKNRNSSGSTAKRKKSEKDC